MSFISEADTFLFSEEENYAKEAFWKHQSLRLAGFFEQEYMYLRYEKNLNVG